MSFSVYETASQALASISDHRRRYVQIAELYESQGIRVTDQDYPIDVFSLKPHSLILPPLLLIGGMGPLAGLSGFESACQLFKNGREIVLFQACSIPNRTIVMAQRQQNQNSNFVEHQLVRMLVEAVQKGSKFLQNKYSQIHVVVLCNAAHCYLPQVQRQLRVNHLKLFNRIKILSLMDAVVDYLHQRDLYHPLLLCTDAARWGGVYTSALRVERIKCIELDEKLQAVLMTGIYEGVKAFNRDIACKTSNQVWSHLLEEQTNIDCVIAGCTEVPLWLKWSQSSGSEKIQQFLSALEVIDPVHCVLSHSERLLLHSPSNKGIPVNTSQSQIPM